MFAKSLDSHTSAAHTQINLLVLEEDKASFAFAISEEKANTHIDSQYTHYIWDFFQCRQSQIPHKQQQEVRLLNVTPCFVVIPYNWLYLSASGDEQQQYLWVAKTSFFAVCTPLLSWVSQCIYRGTDLCRILNFLALSPLKHLLGGIDSPQGREDVSPCTDWIDNAGLNIALWHGGGEEAIFRSVYSATT